MLLPAAPLGMLSRGVVSLQWNANPTYAPPGLLFKFSFHSESRRRRLGCFLNSRFTQNKFSFQSE